MNSVNRKPFVIGIAAITILASSLSNAIASKRALPPAVVYPVVFSNHSGTRTARETAVTAVREALQKAGYPLLSNTSAAQTWKRMRIPMPATGSPAMLHEIIRFGKTMKARYVVAPVFDFHTRSIWVNVGPKTISTATVSVVITNVQTGKVVYVRKNIKGRSDEKNNLAKDAADILISPLVTVVSGGAKTPQEQRAVEIAVGKALKGWVLESK